VRRYPKGYLKLALVSCPIAPHVACSAAERIAFRQINKATGNHLRQQLINEETASRLPRNTKAAVMRQPSISTSSWRIRSSRQSRSRAPIPSRSSRQTPLLRNSA